MAARLGIELSPTACRIVEIEAPRFGRPAGDTRVRSFTLLPPAGAETAAKLASLKGQTAAVVVWNAPSEYRQVVVTGGSYESMRREALNALAAAGLQTKGVLADIAPAAGRPKRGRRQPVVVALASSSEISSALEPLRSAGIQLRTVTTPAAALGSLARLRRKSSVPNAIEAYVALEHNVTCVALVRDSVLVAARELRWGFAEARGAAVATRPQDEIASRLSEDIAEFVTAIGGEPHDIGQVCVIGGLPELRSMTAKMTEHLDVEVEPLDSMFAIDVAQLPEPADEFRDHGAELRLAWAVAADWPPAINLLRARRRRTSRTVLSRAAVAAGVAAGLLVGWRVQQSQWWQARAPKPVPRTAPAAVTARGRATSPDRRQATPPPVAASKPTAPPVATAVNRAPTPPVAPATTAANKPPSGPPAGTAASTPIAAPPAATAANKPPAPATAPTVASKPTSQPVSSPAVAANKPAQPPPATLPPPKPPSTSPAATVATTSTPPRTPPALSRPPTAPNVPALPAPGEPSFARAAPPPLRAEPPAPTATKPASPSRTTAAPPSAPGNAVSTPPAATARPTAPLQSTAAARQPASPPLVRLEPPATTPSVPNRAQPTSAPARAPASGTVPQSSPTPPVARTPLEPIPVQPVPAAPPARARPAVPPEVALPFDAALGTILYSADRKLAIVDGRIVGIGDEVRGARVVDITQTAVMLRDAQGRLRRLTLGAGAR
jgi:hypothetical protein